MLPKSPNKLQSVVVLNLCRAGLHWACASAALGISPALAQQLETVEVRAARLPAASGDRAFSTVEISPEMLAASDRLDTALTSTPGVQLFRRVSSAGANPTTQGISVRGIAGSGAGRALVTLDGAPQNDPFGGWVLWSALPPEAIGAARIVRGAGAGPYGAGALTGVILLEEKSDDPGFSGEHVASENGYGRSAIAGALPVGPGRVFANLTSESGGSWTPVREGRGGADASLSLRALNGAARLSADAGRATASLRISAFEESRNSGLNGAESEASGTTASFSIAAPPEDHVIGWRFQTWWRGSDLSNSSVSVPINANRATATPANDQYETPADGYGANAAVRWLRSIYSFEVGADARWAQGETRERFRYMSGAFTRNRIAGGESFVGGVYAEATRDETDWLLTGGIRLDAWRSTEAKRIESDLATGAVTLDSRARDADGVNPTARLALRRAIGDKLYVRAGAYSGFRPATLNELHRPFRVGNDVTEANSALDPEKLYGVELGFGRDAQNGAWNLNFFANRLEDAIANVTIGGPGTYAIAGFIPAGGVLRQRQNAGEIEALGVEGQISQNFGEALRLSAAFNYTGARIDGHAAAPQLTGLRPAQTPRFSASAGARWRATERVALAVDAVYESERWDDDQNTRALQPALTVNARTDLSVSNQMSLFAAVDNLTDAEVEIAQTGDGVESFAAPRRLRIGLAWRK